MNCQEYKAIISAHVDRVLCAEEATEANAHQESCPKCAQIYAWETTATKLLKQSLSPLAAPEHLRDKILARLSPAETAGRRWFFEFYGWAPAVALLLIFISVYGLWPLDRREDPLTHTARHYQRLSNEPEQVVAAGGTQSTARILDLTPWGYQLFGQELSAVTGRENRIFAYRGTETDLLVAHELDGQTLPDSHGATVIKKSGRDFVVSSSGDITLVAWQDDNMLCVLASKLSQERMLVLATEIARRG